VYGGDQMGRPSQDSKSSFSKEPSCALEEMMERFGTVVIRTAYFYLRDMHLAEDISQEAFIRAYRNWDKFRGDSSVKTWIIRIVINLCRDKIRLKSSSEEPTDPSQIKLVFPFNLEEEVINRINHTQVLKQVLKIPEHYQEVIYLYYYLDLNTKEIAKATKKPEGTVRGRLFRARKLLGEILEEEGLAK
jgi:RNA polymerase sigma-70 factor, ECF subfamily